VKGQQGTKAANTASYISLERVFLSSRNLGMVGRMSYLRLDQIHGSRLPSSKFQMTISVCGTVCLINLVF